jgi:magnesium transporter
MRQEQPTVGPAAGEDDTDERETAGALMTSKYVAVRSSMRVADVLDFLRRESPPERDVYYLYVMDDAGRLEGTLGLRPLVVADAGTAVRDIMNRNVISVHTRTEQEELVRRMTAHRLQALPVVDGEGMLVGTIAPDAVISVAEEEATEDIHKLGGLDALDEPYDRTAFWPMIHKRGRWLAALFIGETLTATALGRYETEIARAVVLALFVPLVTRLAATIAVSLVGVVCFGTLAGSMLPFLLLRLGVDPATSSTPFVATLVDVTGLLIYFQVASVILRGTLL